MAASKNSSGHRAASANGTSAVIRVALYARVSTADQNTDMQVVEMREVAAQRGWVIVDEYVDEGVSGTATSRPALDRMLDDARRGRVDLVVVWKIDRLARSLQHLLTMLDELTNIGVAFTSVRDPGIDTSSQSPMSRLLLQLLGAFSELEKSMIRERTMAGVARARAKGKHIGRPVVEVDLRAAVAMLNEGYGLKAIAKATGISRSTLRRRLTEAGHLDLTPEIVGVQNSPSEAVVK